jgi:hypothetical protein
VRFVRRFLPLSGRPVRRKIHRLPQPAPAMEPFPSPVDPTPSSVLFKETSTGSPGARVDELTALNRTRSGEAQLATSNLRRANTVAQGGNLIRRNLELKATRNRNATTGTRPRGSKERLRKDALQRSQTHRDPRPGPPPGRKAGHFTVGSVGQNGKIFLRYDYQIFDLYIPSYPFGTAC